MTAQVRRRREGIARIVLSDLYFHSLGLVGLNVLWGTALTAIVAAALFWSPAAILATPVLAVPGVAIVRMAARIVRGDADRSIRGALPSTPTDVAGSLALGAALPLAMTVLVSNAVLGLTGTQPLGWLIGAMAIWGLPIVVDPWRRDRRLAERLRVAALVGFAEPRRTVLTAGVLAAFLVASGILVVVLLSTGLAVTALVACRTALPRADALDRPGAAG
jgi:hypothetical protein